MGNRNQGEKSPTDKAERKRKLAAQRQARLRASRPPEVRGIYAPADEHAEIKAFAKGLNKRNGVAMLADLQWMGDQWRAVAHDHMHIYRAEHKNPNDAIMELAWLVDHANVNN